ncbi:MAG: FlgD immunoglobulin-like domain containing protein, partial [Candidatus Thermoplasmatota archaeon]
QGEVAGPGDGFVSLSAGGYHNLGLRNAALSHAGDPGMPGVHPGPDRLCVLSVIPNPFVASAMISFETHDAGPVSLEAHDVAGRRVAALDLGFLLPGRHGVAWRAQEPAGRGCAAGVYSVRLRGAADASRPVRALLVR